MKNVLLKNVPEAEWIAFKTEATSNNMKLGEFLALLIREYTKKHDNSRWKRILNYKSTRSTKELNTHEENIKKFRKSFTLTR